MAEEADIKAWALEPHRHRVIVLLFHSMFLAGDLMSLEVHFICKMEIIIPNIVTQVA